MPEQSKSGSPHAADFAHNMMQAAAHAHALTQRFVKRQAEAGHKLPFDPLNVSSAFMEYFAHLLRDPAKVMEMHADLWKRYVDMWQQTAAEFFGHQTPQEKEAAKDRRFKDPAWQENAIFDFLKHSYLVTARWMLNAVNQNTEGLDPKTAQKVEFYTRQFVDALSPSNFLLTNPEALRATLESGGQNLVKGFENMLEDIERGGGKLRIRMTDETAFEVGKNLAVTPGKVVFRNELIELLQYTPTTKEVFKTPVLMVPAWINKFYILDMQPDNSLVKWLVGQGHTVFVVSWVNPDERLSTKTFEDYMREGLLAALDAVEQATGVKQVNAVGYCLGGTLLASTLAWLAAKGKASRVASATFLTTMVDFSDVGELGVFIDDAQLTSLENRMKEKGYLESSEMAMTFNMLRANELIWSFVVNNYLLGKDPFPFDLLYWNSDATRMPAAMHSFYLRNMYQRNLLKEPGGITLNGVKIDVRKIETPSFFLSTREDHIAPWKSTYAATQLFHGKNTFVLAASGHIAGVVNPPARKKYSHWVNTKLPADPETWLKGAKENTGSWWEMWSEWLAQYSEGKVPARKPGEGKLDLLDDAPGQYVKMK